MSSTTARSTATCRLAAATGDTAAAHVVELSVDSVASPLSAGGSLRQRQACRASCCWPDAIDDRLPFVGQRVMPLPMNSAYRDQGIRTLPATEVGEEMTRSCRRAMRARLVRLAPCRRVGRSGASRRGRRWAPAKSAPRVPVMPARSGIGIRARCSICGIKDCRHVIATILEPARSWRRFASSTTPNG